MERRKQQKRTLLRRGGKGSPFALPGSFSLLLAFHAGLLVMLALTNLLENAAAGTLPLKPFERTFQGLIFTDSNLRHFYPSSRSTKRLSGFAGPESGKTVLLLYSNSGAASMFFSKFIGCTGERETVQLCKQSHGTLPASGFRRSSEKREMVRSGIWVDFRPFAPTADGHPEYENEDAALIGRRPDHNWR